MIQWTKQLIPAKYRAYLHLAAFNVQLQGQRTVLFQSQICNQRSLNKYYNRSSSTRHMLSKFSTTTFDSQVFSYVGAIGAIIAALVLGSDRVNEATAIVPESHESPFKQEQTLGLANLASAIRHNSCSTQKQASELAPSFRYTAAWNAFPTHVPAWRQLELSSRRLSLLDDTAAYAATVYVLRGYRLMWMHQVHSETRYMFKNETIHSTNKYILAAN